MSEPLSSPKLSTASDTVPWYQYYAGYRSSFVADAITRFCPDAKLILDPWNGSGTTTAVAVSKGIACVGFDINPAMTAVARGRLTPASIADSLGAVASEAVRYGALADKDISTSDPLLVWFKRPAAMRIRSLCSAVEAITWTEHPAESFGLSRVDKMPLITAFMYTALFAAAREILAPFRASNPTWVRYPSSASQRLNPTLDTISESFLRHVAQLAGRLVVNDEKGPAKAAVRTGDSAIVDLLPQDNEPFDAVITSPPYCTRIDYIRSSLPELAVLGASATEIKALRHQTLGTPVVRGFAHTAAIGEWSPYVEQLLDSVTRHGSKGSRTYYGPWLTKYFVSLRSACQKLTDATRPSGRIMMVVQNSYYKEVPIDLQQATAEILSSAGCQLVERVDFDVRHLRSSMNPRRHEKESKLTTIESLLVMDRKETR